MKRVSQTMRVSRKKVILTTIIAVGLLAAAGLSKPGQRALGGLLALATGKGAGTATGGEQQATGSAQTAVTGDVGQRAQAAQGWNAGVTSTLLRGEMISYDASGQPTRQLAVTIFRKYPDRVRIEINRGTSTDVQGFDRLLAWQSGLRLLPEAQASAVRAFLRMSPERLFVTRAGGAAYREIGPRYEDTADGAGQKVYDQVEMEDVIGLPPILGRAGDRRLVDYYVDRESNLVSTARWLEPSDTTQTIDQAPSLIDVRVDFSDWRTAGGVKWPFAISHSRGGQLDYRIQVNEVVVNPSLLDSIFINPNQ